MSPVDLQATVANVPPSGAQRHEFPPPRSLRQFDPENGPSGFVRRPSWGLWRWRFAYRRTDTFTCDADGNSGASLKPQAYSLSESVSIAALLDRGGVGLIVGPNSGIVGVTLERCVDKSGRISDDAQRLVVAFGSYAEVSPTETGITVIAGALLAHPHAALRRDRLRIYGVDEVVPVTGWRIPGSPTEARRIDTEPERLFRAVLS